MKPPASAPMNRQMKWRPTAMRVTKMHDTAIYIKVCRSGFHLGPSFRNMMP